jgi:2-polyprenyl-6-hydroxyphenyl methylase / 3-demethylubiquinone-9 3-methyltransferase
MTEPLTVDNKEVGNFTSIAESWWDLNGSFSVLHKLNPVRVKYIFNKCGENLKDKHILDFGCGGGIVSEALARMGARVTGIDAGEENIEVAKLHAMEMGLNIDYIHKSIEEYASDIKFDVLLALEILEHVADVKLTLEYCSKLVKKDGLIILSTINRNAASFLKAIVAAEYVLNIVPKGTHKHSKFLKPSEIGEILTSNDFRLESVDGLKYDPFSGKFSMTDDCRVNYFLTARKVG